MAAGARFCDQCGTAVESEAGADTPAARKVVTVLFADLVGSTSFGERVDAESAREAMSEFHEMLQTTIDGAGGTVAKFTGDGAMAVFGVPEIAEDDADRAVAAGLGLQRAFVPIRARVARRHGIELGLRVGINTGEIVLAGGDADLIGDAINTAARLEAACDPGKVLVGEDTWRLTRSHVRYEVRGEVSVRGKDEPVATFLVADGELHEDAATPFVGRTTELEQLRAQYDDAVEQRSARLATVIGAPGVGKTRLAREFAESLGESAVVAELRCERAGTSTFAPISDLLRSVTAIDDDTDTDQVRTALGELVAGLDDADRVTELLMGFLGAAEARSTEEAFLAVRRLVEATGRQQPLVVVVDDIQWAQPLFLDLLEHLADWVRDAPALLIGLARPELRDLRPSLAEEGRTLATTIGLEGLDPAATSDLAAQLVGAGPLPPELVARLPDSTEGNPLFVRELMRMLVHDSVIEKADDEWRMTIDVDAVDVPVTIQSLLAARIDRLPGDERRLVELASVVGPEFPLGAVAVISGSDEADLRSTLDRLRRRELVEPTGMYWGDQPIHRFHHVLIRDAAYRRLLKRARADLHVRVGEWTERTSAGITGEHEVAIAHHFEQAHEYHRQLDDVDDASAAIGHRAAELLGRAAERALERDDLTAASNLAERALARLQPADPMVASMLVVAAEALLGLGDVARGQPVLERLGAVVGDDPALAPWVESFVAQVTMLTEPGRLHGAEEQADRAAVRLAELGDESGVAKARLVRAGALARLGQVGRCEAELDQALTAARSAGDRRRVAAVLGAAPLAALWGPSPIPRAGGRCLDVIRLLRITTGSPAVEATSVRCQAVLEALRGRFDTARSMLADSRATVEELGLRHAMSETDLHTGIVELLAGEPAAAEHPLRAAYQGLGRLGIGADAGQAAAHLARSLLLQGRVDEAEELAAESAELAGENPQTAIAARTAQAEILAAQGRYDEAVTVAREAVARAEGTDIIVDHAAASAVLARVAAAAGETSTAERAARAAVDLYDQKAATVSVPAPTGGVAAGAAAANGLEPATSRERVRDDEPQNEADRLARRFVEAFTAGAREEWLPMLSPDQVTMDRRPLGFDTTGADGVADAYPRDRDTGALTSEVETIAVRGDSFALIRWRAASDHGREWDGYHLTRWNDEGLNDLNVIFPPDELTAALDELDRLSAGAAPQSPEPDLPRTRTAATPGPWNEADRLTRAFFDRLMDPSRDDWPELLAAEFVEDDRRAVVGGGVTGRAEYVELWSGGQAAPGYDLALTTIATRGDRLVLHRSSMSNDGIATEFVQIGQWRDDGLIERQVRLDAADLDGARAELDRLWFASLEERRRQVSRLAVALGEAWVAPSTHPFDEMLARDFELVDGRTLGMGSLDRDGFEAALRGREADGTSGVPVPSRVEFVSDDVMVFRANNLGHAPDSGVDWEEIACNVLVVDGERIARLEMFDEDHWDEAMARARYLAPVGRGPTALANSASRHARESLAQFVTGRLDADSFTDDYLREDRRTLVSDDVADHGRFLEGVRSAVELGGSYEVEPLAVRGDRFGLCRIRIDWSQDRVTEFLLVNEVEDGRRVRRTVHFDAEEVVTAQDELDEMYAASLPGDDAATLRTAMAFRDAYAALDIERASALLADDFRTVDHRPASWPSMDRERWAAANSRRQAVMGESHIVTTRIHTIRNGVILAANELSGRAPDTGTEWSEQFVNVFVASDGRMRRVESYPPGDLEAAWARAEELIAERSDRRMENAATQVDAAVRRAEQLARDLGRTDIRGVALENAATRWAARGVARHGSADLDDFAADFVCEDRRATATAEPADREQFVESLRVQHDTGAVWSNQVVAVRGDRFGLLRSTSEHHGGRTEFLTVIEVDDGGRAQRLTHFDPDDLPGATEVMSQAWAATLPRELIGPLRLAATYERVAYTAGLDGGEFFEDDAVVVDHRSVGLGVSDVAGYLRLHGHRAEDGPVTGFAPEVVPVGPNVLLFSNVNTIEAGAGASWEEFYFQVFLARDGKIARLELFAEDQRDDAFRRARELADS